MNMKHSGKKALSVILSVCMLLSLLPAMTIGALAAGGTVKVGNESTPAATAYTGTGWSWTPAAGSTPGTLTLSGVNLTSAGILLTCDANLVLEGANYISGSVTSSGYTAAIYSSGALTVGGSGTLKIAPGSFQFGIYASSLIFNSGYIEVSVNYSSHPNAIYSTSTTGITVNGGYISATAVGTQATCLYAPNSILSMAVM